MPYRRIPNTDSTRLKALKTILDCNELYTVGNRFIDWTMMSRARNIYEQLFTAVEQYGINYRAQIRNSKKVEPMRAKATLYVIHFLKVLLMSVERGEIKKHQLKLYGLSEDTTTLPNVRTLERLFEFGRMAVEGEKLRIKAGGRPIYNPSAGMVNTHVDIFRETYEQQKRLQERTDIAQKQLLKLRPEADEVILSLWNQIEEHYSGQPLKQHIDTLARFGIKYYYRPNERKKYGL